MSVFPPRTWFYVVDCFAAADPYQYACADCVFLAAGSTLADFKHAVKNKQSNKLALHRPD
jgi:hypothetical protein